MKSSLTDYIQQQISTLSASYLFYGVSTPGIQAGTTKNKLYT